MLRSRFLRLAALTTCVTHGRLQSGARVTVHENAKDALAGKPFVILTDTKTSN